MAGAKCFEDAGGDEQPLERTLGSEGLKRTTAFHQHLAPVWTLPFGKIFSFGNKKDLGMQRLAFSPTGVLFSDLTSPWGDLPEEQP